MTRPGSVAVIVVNFNGGAYLHRCLTTIAAQSRRPDHVIVVDNASTDGSIAEAQQRFPQYRFVVNPTNLGFATANNQALELCMAMDLEYVALLNPDAFASPRWLEALLVAAAADPGYGSWASCLLRADAPAEIDGLGDTYHVSGSAWRRHHGQRMNPQWLTDQDVFCACAAAALYRLDAVQRAGGFDADLFCYLEDVDLGFRLRLLGYGCRLVVGAQVEHVGSGLTGYRSATATYYGQRNLVWVFAKNMPAGLLWFLLPVHILLNAMMILVCAARGQLNVVLRAKVDALRGLRSLPAKRRAVQSTATAPTSAIWRMLSKSLVHGS